MKNILKEGKKTAIDIKKELLTLEEYKNKSRQAMSKENVCEKELREKEREVDDEISRMIRKRRSDVEDTYKDRISKLKARSKKISSRREKSKDAKMSERIKEETADYYSDNRIINSDIKSVMFKEKISAFYRTDLFFSLFMPHGLLDLLKLLIVALILLIPVPLFTIKATPWEEGTFLTVLLYAIIILFFGGIYIVVRNTKVAPRATVLKNIYEKKKLIKKNKKKIKSTTKSILKEKDDTVYNLDKYDKEIEDVDKEMDAAVKEQKAALETFENSTRFMIENEIRSRHEDEIEKLTDNYKNAKKDADRLEDAVNKMEMDVSKKYDAYLGKDFLKVDKVDAIIEIIQKGEADTIGEAMEVYKTKY